MWVQPPRDRGACQGAEVPPAGLLGIDDAVESQIDGVHAVLARARIVSGVMVASTSRNAGWKRSRPLRALGGDFCGDADDQQRGRRRRQGVGLDRREGGDQRRGGASPCG
jgi:hypothetical protein